MIPERLGGGVNAEVLDYLRDRSAHSDVVAALETAVAPLGGVRLYCPEPAQYRFVAVSTGGVIFGYAAGMHVVGFRLSPKFESRALATGAEARPEAGPGWVSFILFRDDWPQTDLAFWARKAYLYARGESDT